MENTTKAVVENKVAEKKAVEKKEVKKFDYKAVAEATEKAFKSDARVEVIADTNKENPSALAYDDYKFIHFYTPGTEKDLFQLYISKKGAKFIIRLAAADYLDKSVERKVEEKTITNKAGEKQKKPIHVTVQCPIEAISDVAGKIIDAYASIPAKEPKAKKKAEKKTAEPEKVVEKKAEPKKEPKKATVAKRPEKKVVNK